MTTEQTKKLELVVDRLLVKTQDGLCEWKKKDQNDKFFLKLSIAELCLYHIADTIYLEVLRNDVIIAKLQQSQKSNDTSMSRLFNTVVDYHNNYVNTHLDKLMKELQDLGNQPF